MSDPAKQIAACSDAGVREPRHEDALPGELKPLPWVPDRGPITDAEALGVARRRRRVELAGQPKTTGQRSGVPQELPADSSPKKAAVFRLPARAMAIAHARAEMEGVPLTAVLEEMLVAYAGGAPQNPEEVQQRLRAAGHLRQRR
ncbi:hypothetical protein [Gephyromycinifex aptenodytis]|uniref:hypothetical protein n=1 Tax=Gephyromycinifex aptenodytis TaxID=2716227 RepID=UPI001445EAF6|nr:hypothetical protein [Gephyromycinifex aptenodytis]